MELLNLHRYASSLCFSFLISICLAAGNEPIADTALNGKVGYTANDVPELNCPVGVVTDMMCLDCFTMAFCDGKGNAVYKPCPAATPFCNNKICSKERNMNWDVCDEQLLELELSCTDEGYFPDPLNCQTYYFCPDPTVLPRVPRVTYNCPDNHVYDSKTFQCTALLKHNSNCATMVCTQPSPPFLLYPGNANYYGFCKPSEIRPVMFKCPAGQNFNVETYGCELTCSQPGFIAATHCRNYYYCYLVGGQYMKLLQSCSNGYLWNQERQSCELDTTRKCVN